MKIAENEGIREDVVKWVEWLDGAPAQLNKLSVVRLAQHVKAALTGKPLSDKSNQQYIYDLIDQINEMVFPGVQRTCKHIDRHAIIGTSKDGLKITAIEREPWENSERVILKCENCGHVFSRNLRRFIYNYNYQGKTVCPECKNKRKFRF